MFKKRTHEQEEVHKHLVERAKTTTETSTVTTTAPDGITTTTHAGGGVITIVIELTTAGSANVTNATSSANSTSALPTNSSTITLPSTTSSPITSIPVNSTVPHPASDNSTVGHSALSTGSVAGISVASTVGGLALLGLIAYLFRKRSSDRRHSTLDMMMKNSDIPSSFPDPYQSRFSAVGNMPSQGRYEGLDDEDDGPEGDASQMSRRRSARSFPASPY